MTVSEPNPSLTLAAEAPPRKKFTREEVNRLLETGIFEGQRFELIDGDLIDKMGQNPPHAFSIRLVAKWLQGVFPAECVQVQLPIELSGDDAESSVPEPDIAALPSLKPEYARRHPYASELVLALEVTDTRATFDLGRKAELYARSDVPEYWVLDIGRRLLTVHRQPDGARYRLIRIFSEDELVSLENRNEAVKVGELLPGSGQ